MKRCACAVAVGLLLALASTGTATAGLPILGETQTGAQSTTFGDQAVGEQKNDADMTQSQGNGNINVSPAVAILGDASTWNAQGNGNTADADVDQSNTATQSQGSSQSQELDQGGGSCCGDQSQTGEQSMSYGDQTVGEQKNDADMTQSQGNGNVNVSPAIGIGGKPGSCHSKCGEAWKPRGGDASTWNGQGNGNSATADVDQSNSAAQSQSAQQSQSLDQKGGAGESCCPSGGKPDHPKPAACGDRSDRESCWKPGRPSCGKGGWKADGPHHEHCKPTHPAPAHPCWKPEPRRWDPCEKGGRLLF